LYINTLSFGAMQAVQISISGSNNSRFAAAAAAAMLCSHQHKLAGYPLENCQLFASSIVGDTRSFLPLHQKVHQGELFRAVLPGSFFFTCTKFLEWVAAENTIIREESYHVVIKVSSLSVHDTLVKPSTAVTALTKAHGCTNLADSLLGVWSPSQVCMVTIMRDLDRERFHELKPCTCSEQHLATLWSAFVMLVNRILLPLAQKDIVHCDIRPGWDYTANIMMRQEFDGLSASCCVIDLRVIDFESLVRIRDCDALPKTSNSFHITYDRQPREETGLSFLWWQCMLVANAWLGRKPMESINAPDFVSGCCKGKIGDYIADLTKKGNFKAEQYCLW